MNIGTYVAGTRWLGDDGIVEAPFTGVIIKNENDIITVANDDYKYITGPDSITPTSPPNAFTGRRVRVTSDRTGIDADAVGQEGIIVGWYGDRPYVVLDNGPHYQYRRSGSWVVVDFEYVDTPAVEEPITFATKERMIGKRIRVVHASGHQRYVGVEGVVTEVFYMREQNPRWTNKVDGITVKIAETDGSWVQDYIVLDDEPVTQPETPALMEVGQRVRYTSGEFVGQYGTITRVDENDPTLPYYVEVDGGAGRGWTGRVEATDAPAPDMATTQLEAENRRLRERIVRMERDWEINDEAIKEEAVRRGWCGDYERVTGAINRNMSEFSYSPREVEFELEVEVTGTMTTTRTVTVRAADEDEARERFDENPDDYLDSDSALTEASRSDSFTDVETNITNISQ